jgi:hypothetical protein
MVGSNILSHSEIIDYHALIQEHVVDRNANQSPKHRPRRQDAESAAAVS